MSGLFKRTVKVTLASQPTGFVGSNPGFFEQLGNALEITAMRIRFDVTKNLGKEPNKCLIKLDNLSADTRNEIETKKPLRCTLQAGYDGAPRLLFVGDVVQAYSKREGTEIVTYVKVSDGMRAYSHARVNRSYKPPIQVKKVLSDCAKTMGLQLPPEVEQSAELKQALAVGISTHGATRDVLTRLLAPYGYNWSVQNGALQILKDDEIKPGHAYLISKEDSGLIGIPERTTPESPKKSVEIKFETLLYPELQPGQLAKLQSELLNAQMKMTDVAHTGDSYDTGDYKTSVTGRPL